MKYLMIVALGLLSLNAFADDLAIQCQNGIDLQSTLPYEDGAVSDAALILNHKTVSGTKTVARGKLIIVTTSGSERRQYIFNAHVDGSGECRTGSVSVYSVGGSAGRKLLNTEHCTCDVD